MSKIFFTSDLHFGHDKAFLYEPRGFTSVYEHDEAIIKNWNEIVSFDDEVYVLGDLMLGNQEYGLNCIRRLNGNIHVIRGNHDTDKKVESYSRMYKIKEVVTAKFFHYKQFHFYLSHFPTITSNFDEDTKLYKKYINLHGHTHSKEKFTQGYCMYNVALDANDNKPISLDEIIEIMKRKLGEG